jgi:hypothetical protein
LPKKLSHLDENENPTKDDNLKSKEEIESLSSLEDKSVIREDVPSETFSPSKASLSLKHCVDIIRDQLHIKETSVGAVIRLALEAFDTPELTDMCDLATASQSVDFIDDDEEVKAEELGILQCVLWIILLLIGVEVVLSKIN